MPFFAGGFLGGPFFLFCSAGDPVGGPIGDPPRSGGGSNPSAIGGGARPGGSSGTPGGATPGVDPTGTGATPGITGGSPWSEGTEGITEGATPGGGGTGGGDVSGIAGRLEGLVRGGSLGGRPGADKADLLRESILIWSVFLRIVHGMHMH
eukprot:1196982-Amorphochlora_amoeboformis.AAC.1